MNLNKNFLTEVIKYLINRGVTLTDVLDTFNEHFNTLDTNDIKREHEKQYEVRKPITDIDLMLCGKSVEESSTPCQKVKKKTKNTEKPVNKSCIDYPKNIENHGNGVSPARKALFDVINGKTVIEHLKENGITYTNFDNRIRKKWSVEQACTTPLAPWGKGKRKRAIEESEEPEEPDTIICLEPEKITGTKVKVVEESSPKTKMMLVNGRMTEMKVSDTDLIQSSIEKPAETLETKTETLETESNTEKATESVTIEPQTKTDTDTRVNDTNANSDAIHKDKDDNIEKALKKFITSTTGIKYEESRKDKKPKEVKADLSVLEVCQKMNITTHELKKMIATGDFPQPDCDKKWSVKLLKKEGII